MPRARDSQFPVLTHLKELSQEADQNLADFPAESAVDAWFDAVKESFIKIRDCTEVKVFDYPPSSSSIYGQDKINRNVNEVSENQIAHIHANKLTVTFVENCDERKDKIDIDSKDPHDSFLEHKNEIDSVPNEVEQKNSQYHIPSNKRALQTKTSCSPKAKMQCSPNAKTPHTPKIKTPRAPKAKTPYTPKVVLMPLKISLLQNCFTNSSEKLQTPVMNRTFVGSINASSVLLSSQSTNSANSSKGVDSYSAIKTRSSLKRKSSISKEGSNKRQKTKTSKGIPGGKTAYPKCLVEKLPSMKIITVGTENRAKLPVVVVPTLQTKHTPVPSKEKQILEEIKKKEEKAIENRKRVLEERKIKAEENKKKREEKREKTVLKRLKIEKEKEEKREIESKKSQVMKEATKKPGIKSRVKELIDQSAKESKSGPLSSSKQNEMNGDIFKTPASKKSFDSENYELTPVPDSSTYDISEGEDDRPAGKHIPLWAQGAYIKSALIQQFYNPLNTDDVFGSAVDPPDLTEIFSVQKKRYKMRTSSAIWNTPPDRSLRH